MDPSNEFVIKCDRINTFRGTVHAIRDVSISIGKGVTCVVGPNGAGKTTLIKSIMGLLTIHSGSIHFLGQDITRLDSHKIAALGMGYAPEDRRIFPDFTVTENILLSLWGRKVNREEIFGKIYTLFPELRKLEYSKGGHLSGGEQSMVSMARAMAIEPRCLLLDEPLEGLAPVVRKRLMETIIELRGQGLPTITTASDLSYTPGIADAILTMERGEVVGVTHGEK